MDIQVISIAALGEFILMSTPYAEVRNERVQALYSIHSKLWK